MGLEVIGGDSYSMVDPDLGQHGLCVPYHNLGCFPGVSIINVSEL